VATSWHSRWLEIANVWGLIWRNRGSMRIARTGVTSKFFSTILKGSKVR